MNINLPHHHGKCSYAYVFGLTVFSDFDRYKFYVCEAHFRAELIGAGLMIIVGNSGKVFAFFTLGVSM